MLITLTPSEIRSALATGGKYSSQWLGSANLQVREDTYYNNTAYMYVLSRKN